MPRPLARVVLIGLLIAVTPELSSLSAQLQTSGRGGAASGRFPRVDAASQQARRAHLKNERLDTVTSIRGLPLGVRNGLQTLFDSETLDIAEPGAGFQLTPVAGQSKLPIRRLLAAGCSIDHCLVYYERGGSAHTWLVALFHWTPAATRFEWGGTAPAGLKTIEDVRKAVLSGAIKGPNKVW